MARKTVTLRANRDGTLTVRVGRAVEHITYVGIPRADVWDKVRYACISKGINLNNTEMIELMREAKGL